MKEATLEEIKENALHAKSNGIKWHYHFMSPSCNLYTSNLYAIVYEQEGLTDQLVNYSENGDMEFSKELATLLHGTKVVHDTSLKDVRDFDVDTVAIITLAQALTEQDIVWHHHVLFPGCVFNTDPLKHSLILENPTNNETLVALSELEPKDALGHIEKLFYRDTRSK